MEDIAVKALMPISRLDENKCISALLYTKKLNIQTLKEVQYEARGTFNLTVIDRDEMISNCSILGFQIERYLGDHIGDRRYAIRNKTGN